jgi:hypothetical protein
MANKKRSPTKLNSTTQELICEAISRGITKKIDIAALAGVNTETINQWMRWASDPSAEHHIVAKRLQQAMQLATVRRKLWLLESMTRAGENDWRMYAQQLRWLDPEEYGDKNSVNLSGEVKTGDSLTDEQRIAALTRIFDAARKRSSVELDDGAKPLAPAGEAGTT